MLTGHATAEATAAYAGAHRARHADDFYGVTQGLTLSSLGLGTYLGGADPETDARYAGAVRAAVAGGINHLDTAINYRAQASERMLGKVLADLVAHGELTREQVVVASKGGFNPRDRDSPDRGGRALLAGIPEEEVADGHCIHPVYLARVLARSRENLGLATLDIYYLHNPESQLGKVAKPIFYQRIRKAFTALEGARERGEIVRYGAATWEGFRREAGDREGLDLARMVDIANAVGGADHGFRVVQLPLSLGLPQALTTAGQTVEDQALPALEAARALGLTVVTSGPLAQGNLLTDGLAPAVADALDPARVLSDAQRALHWARSCGADSTLVGMTSLEHVSENLAVAARPRAERAALLAALGDA